MKKKNSNLVVGTLQFNYLKYVDSKSVVDVPLKSDLTIIILFVCNAVYVPIIILS